MKTAELLRKYRRIINPPYSSKDLPVILATLVILVAIPLTVVAVRTAQELRSRALAGITLSLSPASQSINQGTNFTVQVRENSNSEPVNAVQANLTYDATKLDFVSLDNPPAGTSFTTVAEGSGGAGSIRVARALTGGATPVTGDQLVATITFKAKYVPGATAVSFAAGSAIVRSTDNTDILGSTTPGTYTVVDPPPYNVAITTPANNSIVKGTSVLVQATAQDDLAVTRVEFYVDSETSPRSTVTISPYQYTLNTTSPLLADGAHTISVKAYDAHSTITSAPINVTVDNNAPTSVSITAPVANTLVRQTVTIQTNPQDTPGSGIASVEFYIAGTLKSTDTTSPYSYSWNTTSGYPDGNYALYVKAYDNATNVTTSATINVTVDNTAPTVSITSPASGVYLQGNVSATATPNDANLLNVEFSLGTTLKCTVTASPFTCTNIITASTSDGSYTISAKANDKAGNSTTASVSVTVDNTAPTAPTGLSATVVSGTQINLTWSAATDPNLSGYDVYRGGAKVNAATVATTSYNDTGLSPATSYSYYVKATDKAGNTSAASNTVSATTKKTADINGDGHVDIFDLSALLSRWGTSDAAADLNSNGVVDIFDLSILISSWGS